jgi:hypothetical protein
MDASLPRREHTADQAEQSTLAATAWPVKKKLLARRDIETRDSQARLAFPKPGELEALDFDCVP